jgi:ABC-2 type transport system permease protein
MTTPTALNARWTAVRAGFSRGWIEARQVAVFNYLLPPVAYSLLMFMLRGKTVPGTDFSLAAMMLPGILGQLLAIGGVTGPAASIATDAEDGTLLRAKATPHGMLGYLVGKIVKCGWTTLAGLLALVIPALMVAGDLVFDTRAWLLLASTLVAGMASTVPVGVALGALLKSSLQAGLLLFASMLIVLISGIYFPLSASPTWLQWVAQIFPFYWVGLGARSALLPARMAVAELDHSWRTPETFAVLGVWTMVGMLLAPILLRRMARRQSGSTMAAARQRVMARGF